MRPEAFAPWLPAPPASAAAAEALALELFVGGYEPAELPMTMQRRLAAGLSGVVLFARNLVKEQGSILIDPLTTQTRAVQAAASQHPMCGGLPAICAVDQEGGRVARLRAPFTVLPPMRALAARGDLALTEAVGELVGAECLSAGFNLDFAPVLDIDTNPANPIIGDRAFGSQAAEVIAHAGAFARGLQRSGVAACGKHFPGHGDTAVDSHLALPVIDADVSALEQQELLPFAALAPELPMIMTAHILFRALDAELPATLSPRIIQSLLRGRCGFGGVIVSDDLEMRGVADAFTVEQCVRLGLAAGVDLFLICRDEARLDRAAAEAARILRDQGPGAARARAAIARVRRLRCGLRRPTPDTARLQALWQDASTRALRNQFVLGNV